MFKLPPLPYAYDSLEPYIDARTMEIHHTQHHQIYINNLNEALKEFPALQEKSITDLLIDFENIPEKIKNTVRNNGGGHYNHTFFWNIMTPKSSKKPYEKTISLINKTFNSYEEFQLHFNNAAKSRFGSGWAWLVINKQGDLEITSTANQDSPLLFGQAPLLGLDVWEHAYYLKYQNKRVDYIQSWWNVVDWQKLEDIIKDTF